MRGRLREAQMMCLEICRKIMRVFKFQIAKNCPDYYQFVSNNVFSSGHGLGVLVINQYPVHLWNGLLLNLPFSFQ